MALSLATLTLLTSLFMVAQGFVGAPEALAACSETTWCDPLFTQDTNICCYSVSRRWAHLYRWCYWREWDCTINSYLDNLGAGCYGSFCWGP